MSDDAPIIIIFFGFLFLMVVLLLALAFGEQANYTENKVRCDIAGGMYLDNEGICIRPGSVIPL